MRWAQIAAHPRRIPAGRGAALHARNYSLLPLEIAPILRGPVRRGLGVPGNRSLHFHSIASNLSGECIAARENFCDLQGTDADLRAMAE
jgi:hypothetical protein